MDTIYRESGSMLVPRPPPTLVPWSTLSDRAQWIRWAYLHRQEARKHMAILPGWPGLGLGSAARVHWLGLGFPWS